MELAEKVCLIAGASGTIGTAIAHRFFEEGARLVLTSHTTLPEKLVPGLTGPNGRVARFVLDVTRWDEVLSVVNQAHREFGFIHVLVNCTGMLGPIGPTQNVAVEDWLHAIQTNLLGSFYLTRAVLPVMLAQGQGKIIHFSGGGAAYARPYFTAYSAAKAAVVRFTESVAEEVRDFNIQVNAIAPGPVESRMWEQMRAAADRGGPRLREELRKMNATGGVPPDRAAGLAVFLASDRSDGLTGRLVSSVYDDWEHLDSRISKIMESDAWTLRRVPLE